MRGVRIAAAALGALALGSCKERISPHVAVEGDPEPLVAKAASGSQTGGYAAPAGRIKLTINNSPESDMPVEQELAQQLVNLFEAKNPGIRVEFSTWRFTPEGFYERAKNRTLTDIIEVSASQVPPILDLSYAADITENVASSQEMVNINPEVLRPFKRDDRYFGVPVELHTMALFYNRKLVERVLRPPAPAAPKATPKPVEKSDKKSKGADADPKDFSDMNVRPSFEVAQYRQPRDYYEYQQNDGQQQTNTSRRGEQDVQDYYNLPQQPQRKTRSFWPFSGFNNSQNQNQQQQQPPQQQRVNPNQQEPDDQYNLPASQRRKKSGEDTVTDDAGKSDSDQPESARPRKKRSTIDDDIISTEAEAQAAAPVAPTTGSLTIHVEGLPDNWDKFIRLAVKLTDHNTSTVGYAPVMFAKEGGREFSQWGVQAGLQIEVPAADTATLDVNTSTAADVAQFLKDLRWRYDVTPPIDQCYNDNLMRMFASGKLGMMMLPATRETFVRLTKLGMAIDDIGVAPLPGGPQNRDQLCFGRALVLNSQLDREHRAAAFKWMIFQLDPDVIRMREQFYFREQEITGVPSVPLLTDKRQKELYEKLKPCRTLPLYEDYEKLVASNLVLEPPYFTDRLYEAISEGIRPIVERPDSQPLNSIAVVGLDFENKYLRNAPTKQGLQRYLHLLTGQ